MSVTLLTKAAIRLALGLLLTAAILSASGPADVLVIANRRSALSMRIARYYSDRRNIPSEHLCLIDAPISEGIDHATYQRYIADPVGRCLTERGLVESVLYLVTTSEVPLRVDSNQGTAMQTEIAAVDSELALLYSDLKGRPHPLAGPLPNPFFRQRDAPFRHPNFPIYLVTRLTGYDFEDVKGLIDRAQIAQNRGNFVIDLADKLDGTGDDWLRTAAILLPENRLVFDETTTVLYNQRNVIGYAGWGSNDKHRHERFLHFQWLPGAIMTEFVSTNARTFKKPPDKWTIGDWNHPDTWWERSPQTLTADYIHEGATGASGHVSEPYLQLTPRPELLLPAYYKGRNLAESYYLAIPALSWQNIVVGDPLCTLGPPSGKGR